MTQPRATATLTVDEASRIAESFGYSNRSHHGLNFQNMANRNLVAKIAKARGIKVVKSSIRGQLLDPRYTVEGSSIPDKGLGNDYKHYFSVLYQLETERW